MKYIYALAIASLAVPALLQPAYAADTPLLPPAPPVTQPVPSAMRSQPVTLGVGTGTLLKLPQPATTVLSADPAIARVQPASPDSLFLMGVAAGHTTVIATDAKGNAIVQYDVAVNAPTGHVVGGVAVQTPIGATANAAMASAAQATINQSVAGTDGVRVKAVGADLVVSGTIATPFAAQQAMAIVRAYVGEKGGAVNSLSILGTIQVNVRVRIAEINRQVTRQLGFNWQALGSGNGWSFGLRTGAASAGAINPLLPLGLTALAGSSAVPNQIGAGLISGNKQWDVNNIVDALAADQLISILAEPNLTAQSGETASFLAGGEFPIPVAGATGNGGTTVTVEFKQFGVSLALVPTVLSPSRINLRIRPEVSQLSTNGAVSVPIGTGVITIPALTVRRAETTIELGSGQSFAIAGLLQHTSTDTTNALPGVGEVPVLGALFKSNDFQRGESELVIIVTPYIVQPTSEPQALKAPTDGFKPALDLDRILLGHQLAPSSSGQTVDAGFVLK